MLFGRRPDVAALPADALARVQGAVLPVTLQSRLVSENHLLVWCDGAAVHALDLQSTNGAKLSLGRGRLVSVAANAPVDLELAKLAERPGPKLEAGEWTTAEDFRAGVPGTVTRWLQAQQVYAAVSVVRAPPDELDPPANEIALGDSWVLRVGGAPDRATSDVRLDRLMAEVWAFVHAQRGEIETDRDSRHDDGFVLVSPVSQAVHRRISKAARRGLHGILQGDTGVGKSAFARCFHIHSERQRALQRPAWRW